MLKLLIATLAFSAQDYVALASAQNYIAERDPPAPEVGKHYRLWLRTPGRACNAWRKVSAVIPKEDMLLSEGKRDETGKSPGCKFTFVIKPASPPGDMKFELEPAVGPKEFFEVPAGGRKFTGGGGWGSGGIANENGTGMASGPVKGKLKMGGVGVEQPKPPAKDNPHLNPGTGL